jgi:hypothetical protein
VVRPEHAQEVSLFVVSSGSDDVGTMTLGNLYRSEAHTSGSAVNEDPGAFVHPRQMFKPVAGR